MPSDPRQEALADIRRQLAEASRHRLAQMFPRPTPQAPPEPEAPPEPDYDALASVLGAPEGG